ncbi:MAG: hypothetical protein J0M33_17225 [Anaerolineae bacterium]|nr:hypothetical protein [Anaerolineae bacterium]
MKSLFLCLILLFTLAACESTPPGKPVTWDTLCVPENNDQQVAIEGYPYLPVTALVSDTMLIDLHEEPDREGRLISTSMTLGSGNNQMVEPPDDYTDDDLLIRAGDGTEIRTGQPMKVEGKVLYSETGCVLFAATAIVAVGGS